MTQETPTPDPRARPDLLRAYGDVANVYAIAADLIDDLLKIAAWGIHDSRRDELREKAKAARAELSAIAREYAVRPAVRPVDAPTAPTGTPTPRRPRLTLMEGVDDDR